MNNGWNDTLALSLETEIFDKWKKMEKLWWDQDSNSEPSAVTADSQPVDISHHANTMLSKILDIHTGVVT